MSANAPRVLLRSEESGGHVAIVELGGGGRPPLHRHEFDETYYILEGELTFHLDDDVFTRRAGELGFAPRGVAHTYGNLSSAPARALLVITPAGFERYFDGIAARISAEPPPEAAKPIPEVVTLGPPLDETGGAP
jgi:quercetin dioxygenase-like cupin family protein